MKRRLEFTADTGDVLSLGEIEEFVDQARAIGFWNFSKPKVQLRQESTGRRAVTEGIRKISVERS